MRSPHYGKLGVERLPSEVRCIWYSRHLDIEPCEQLGIYRPTSTDPDLVLIQDFVSRLIDITPLTEAERQVVSLCVLDNCTQREASIEMSKSPVRIGQLLSRALRKFRKHQKELTGLSIIGMGEWNEL